MPITSKERRRRNAIALLNMAMVMAAAGETSAEISYLSGFTISPETGGETALLDITLNPEVTTGDVWFVVALSTATAPDAANVVLGLDGDNAAAVWADTEAAAAVNSFTGPITGLTPEEDYVAYAVWFDGVDVYSSVSAIAFTTLAGVVLPDPGEFVRVTEAREERVTEGGEQRTIETALADVLTGFNVTPIAGGTTASFEVTTSAESGQFYIVTYLASATDPDEEQIEAGTDGDDVAAVWADNVALSSIDDYIPGMSGLVQNTAYKSRAVVRLSATPGDYSNIVSDSWTSADAAPILTSMLAASTGENTALFSVITDDISGSIKWGVYPSTSTPTKANILAGDGGALDFGSVAVSGAGLYSVLDITGLSASTAYKVHAYHVDAGALESDIITSSAFSTTAAETSLFQIAHNGTTTGTLSNLTATTSQTDPLGGSNALTYSKDPAGVLTICTVTNIGNLYAGPVTVRFRVKKGAWPSSGAWLRWRVTNVLPSTPLLAFNLDTGAFASVDALITNNVAIPMGNDWWFVQFNVNMTGFSDINGSATITLGSSSSTASITTSGTHTLHLFNYQGTR